MKIEYQAVADKLVIRLEGELDLHTAEQFRQVVEGALAETGARDLVLNLGRVTFIDSSGLGVILGRYRRLRESGGSMSLVRASSRIKPILELSGILRIITLYGSEQQALEAS